MRVSVSLSPLVGQVFGSVALPDLTLPAQIEITLNDLVLSSAAGDVTATADMHKRAVWLLTFGRVSHNSLTSRII